VGDLRSSLGGVKDPRRAEVQRKTAGDYAPAAILGGVLRGKSAPSF
jgi:hypothetical protein